MVAGILVCGLCGLASAFLGDASPWSMRGATAAPSYFYVIGFVVVSLLAAWKLARPPFKRWHAIVALTGTMTSLFVHRGQLGQLLTLGPIREHSLQSLLYAVALYGGFVTAIGAGLEATARTRVAATTS